MRAGAADTAFDRADGAIADVGGFFVGKTRGADQDQGFALIFRQLVDRLLEVFHVELAHLFGVARKPLGHCAFGIGNLPLALAHLAIELVAQDGEEPALEIGAGRKGGTLVPGPDEGFLDEIVSLVGSADQRHRKSAEIGNYSQKLGAKIVFSHFTPPYFDLDLSSSSPSLPSSSRRRSGTGSATTSS